MHKPLQAVPMKKRVNMPSDMFVNPTLPYTTGMVAKICCVAPRTVAKWCNSGQLKCYRLPNSQDRRITHSELVSFMKRHKLPFPWNMESRVFGFCDTKWNEYLKFDSITNETYSAGEMLSTNAYTHAVVDDSFGLQLAYRMIDKLKEINPLVRIAFLVHESVKLETLRWYKKETVSILKRPITLTHLIESIGFPEERVRHEQVQAIG